MHIHLISVPYDSGVPDVRMGKGPGRLLDAGLLDQLRSWGHEVTHCELRAPAAEVASEVATSFALHGALAAEVRRARAEGRFPLVLAGSCYSSVGTVAGLGDDPVGVIWLDTHADLNTPETTASGFLDGMALSILMGQCFETLAKGIEGHVPLPPEHLLLLGTRDVDPPERERIESMGITVLSPTELSRLDSALVELRSRVERVHLHVDLDVLDPSVAPANTYVAPDGLDAEALNRTVAAVRDRFEVSAVAFTAYDPSVDADVRMPAPVFAALGALLGRAR